jgi:hypothetical protein
LAFADKEELYSFPANSRALIIVWLICVRPSPSGARMMPNVLFTSFGSTLVICLLPSAVGNLMVDVKGSTLLEIEFFCN